MVVIQQPLFKDTLPLATEALFSVPNLKGPARSVSHRDQSDSSSGPHNQAMQASGHPIFAVHTASGRRLSLDLEVSFLTVMANKPGKISCLLEDTGVPSDQTTSLFIPWKDIPGKPPKKQV